MGEVIVWAGPIVCDELLFALRPGVGSGPADPGVIDVVLVERVCLP